ACVPSQCTYPAVDRTLARPPATLERYLLFVEILLEHYRLRSIPCSRAATRSNPLPAPNRLAINERVRCTAPCPSANSPLTSPPKYSPARPQAAPRFPLLKNPSSGRRPPREFPLSSARR